MSHRKIDHEASGSLIANAFGAATARHAAGRAVSAAVAVISSALLLAAPAAATPWWVAWEGNDFPENEGWTHYFGNWNGPGQGQAVRTLENGALKIDSLHDTGVYDYVQRLHSSAGFERGPGELFVAQWRMVLEIAVGAPWGVTSGFYTEGWGVGFRFSVDSLRSIHEPWLPGVSIIPGMFHYYELRSSDMRPYTLLIDGVPRVEGSFTN
ncbi:MAG: hypothetical protein IPM13_11585 [Phycisphaerales bacterium]|nr:hypothetical protein [Phycisphaerales bacterium]